jgi:hypothetical protein
VKWSEMVKCWRINYGLDTRTPEEAGRWWHDGLQGKSPAGAVAALGLALQKVDKVMAENKRLRKQIREMVDANKFDIEKEGK